jgi:peptidoglycan/LPS O-acetylase OafA/YrhL
MEDGAAAALSIANIRFAMTTDYFNPVSYSPFLHFWSLGVEEQFYFVWPALLAWRPGRCPAPGAAVALSSWSWPRSRPASSSPTRPSHGLLHAPDAGLAAGRGRVAGGRRRLARPAARRDPVRWVFRRTVARVRRLGRPGGLITAAFVIDFVGRPYPGMAALVPTVAGVLLIASGRKPLGPGVLLRLPPIRFLGKISYSLYLWHWPILILGGLYPARSGRSGRPSPGQAVALAGLSIPVATLSWFLVEEPFRRGSSRCRAQPGRGAGRGRHADRGVCGHELRLRAPSPRWPAWTAPTPIPRPRPDATDHADGPARRRRTAVLADGLAVPGVTATPDSGDDPGPDAVAGPGAAEFLRVTNGASLPRQCGHGLRAALARQLPGLDAATSPNHLGKCVYGNPSGTYTVALVGDSHASALFPGVNEVAKAHGWKLSRT